jgi:peroxiredoxin
MKVKIIVVLCALAAFLVWAAAVATLSRHTLTRAAPDVRYTELSGETFSTSDLRGKVVLVNFWGSYCTPCIKEMPHLVEAHRKYEARGYETVAIAVRHDNPQRVIRFVKEHELPFRIALDSQGELAKEFGNVRITPTSFLIDRNGRILKRYVAKHDWAELDQLVEKALGS